MQNHFFEIAANTLACGRHQHALEFIKDDIFSASATANWGIRRTLKESSRWDKLSWGYATKPYYVLIS